jgi:hypothetical protein
LVYGRCNLLRRLRNSSFVPFSSGTDALLLHLPLLVGDRLHSGDLTPYFGEERFDGRQPLRRLGTRPLRAVKTSRLSSARLRNMAGNLDLKGTEMSVTSATKLNVALSLETTIVLMRKAPHHPLQGGRFLEVFVRLIIAQRLSSSRRLVWAVVLSALGIVLLSLLQLLRGDVRSLQIPQGSALLLFTGQGHRNRKDHNR